MGNFDPGQGWTIDEQGNRILDLGSDVLHGNGLLNGILPNYYNQAPIIDATNTNQEQGPTFSQGLYELGTGAIQQAQDSYNWAKENPGALASTALSVMPEVGIPAKIASGILGAAYDQYGQNLTPTEKGLGLAMGAFGAIPGGEEAGAAERGFKPFPGVPKAFEPFPPPPAAQEMEDASIHGGLPGYSVFKYDSKPLEEQLGIPRFVKAKDLGVDWLGDVNVGNPEYMQHPATPEGQIFAKRLAARSKDIPDDMVYSGVKPPNFDPESVALDEYTDPTAKMWPDELPYVLDPTTNTWIKAKWASNDADVARSYAKPLLNSNGYKDAIREKIASGEISNSKLPGGFSNTDELSKWLDNPDEYDPKAAKKILAADPRMKGTLQPFIPLFENPKIIDKNNEFFDLHDIQSNQITDAAAQGHDLLMYKNQADPGPGIYASKMKDIDKLMPGMFEKVYNMPTNVYAGLNRAKLKYPFNYGTWDTKDVRPLAAIPLGLGAGLGAYMYNKSNEGQAQ